MLHSLEPLLVFYDTKEKVYRVLKLVSSEVPGYVRKLRILHQLSRYLLKFAIFFLFSHTRLSFPQISLVQATIYLFLGLLPQILSGGILHVLLLTQRVKFLLLLVPLFLSLLLFTPELSKTRRRPI